TLHIGGQSQEVVGPAERPGGGLGRDQSLKRWPETPYPVVVTDVQSSAEEVPCRVGQRLAVAALGSARRQPAVPGQLARGEALKEGERPEQRDLLFGRNRETIQQSAAELLALLSQHSPQPERPQP